MLLFACPNISMAVSGTPSFRSNKRLSFAMPWNGADIGRARLRDLGNEYLCDETFLIELGRCERANFNLAPEHRNHIRTCYWIGNDPEVSRPAQQRRAFKPNPCNKEYERKRRRAQPTKGPPLLQRLDRRRQTGNTFHFRNTTSRRGAHSKKSIEPLR